MSEWWWAFMPFVIIIFAAYLDKYHKWHNFVGMPNLDNCDNCIKKHGRVKRR